MCADDSVFTLPEPPSESILSSKSRYRAPIANIMPPPSILSRVSQSFIFCNLTTHIRGTLSALFAGSMVNTLMPMHETIQVTAVPRFFFINSCP
jgi:hypothetical protein